MRIGIDGCCWSNRRGFGRYTRELVTHMVRKQDDLEFILVVDQQTANECQFPERMTLRVVETKVQPTQAASANGSRSLSDMLRLARAASSLKAGVFFFPAVYSFYPLPKGTPTLVTFHDAIPETHPNLIFPSWKSRLLWNMKTRLAIHQATRLLTVSEAARVQIISNFNLPTSQVEVVTEGPGEGFPPVNDQELIREVLDKYGIPTDRRLILYVGGISPHKNLQGLLNALTHVDEHTSSGWHLVIVGDYEHDGGDAIANSSSRAGS